MYKMYITDDKETVVFPITPAKMTMKINNQNKTITLINEGEVNLIKSPGLTDISTEIILPVVKYPFAVYENDYNNSFLRADYYLEKLEEWKIGRKKVTFNMTRTLPDNVTETWNTTKTVTIENYTIEEDADQGMDVKVKLEMKQYEYWGVKKLVTKKNKKTQKTTATVKKTRKSKSIAPNYVVQERDTLRTIAKQQLNDESKWEKIYTLNKKTIESTAKKQGRKSSSNGWWIYPGTKLKLPGGKS